MKPLYIIPARGGSKGIPGKNIKPFMGKPLLVHTVEAALAVAGGEPQRVVLSTDSQAIADVARAAGLDTGGYMRPGELATDSAGSREVMIHAMDHALGAGIDFDTVVLLQPTSPLRTVADIRATERAYSERMPAIDMAVTVTPAPANPYYDIFETDGEGFLTVSKGSGLITRRQDAPRAWVYNGAVYVINPESLRLMPLGAMKRRVGVEMPRERSVDLDTPLDWLIAETIASSHLDQPQ